MPAVPVPETGKVRLFLVPKTQRSSATVSSIISTNSVSKYPNIGVVIALSTRALASLGPGPSSTRGDAINSSYTFLIGSSDTA